MEIKVDGFILRPLRFGDEHSISKNGNNREIWRNLSHRFPHPYTVEEALAWIKICQDPVKRETTFGIEVDGEVAGLIEFRLQEGVDQKTSMLAYWLGEGYWGRGIAKKAVGLVTDYAFDNFDLVRMQADVYEWSVASMRVLEKNNYTLEARLRKAIFKDGQVIDKLVYAKLNDR